MSEAVEFVHVRVCLPSSKEHDLVDWVVLRKILIGTDWQTAHNPAPLMCRLAVLHDRPIRSRFEGRVDKRIPFRKPCNPDSNTVVSHDARGNGREIAPDL